MADIQVLTLAPEEWRQYQQIRLEALKAEPQAFTSRYADQLHRPESYWRERLIGAQAEEKSWLLFAKENDLIVGMTGAFSAGDSEVVEIISVYVTREARGHRVASTLMAAILEEVTKAGAFRKAVLTVNAGQTAAVALYRRFGFQSVGEMSVAMGDGRPYLCYIMEKEL